MDPNDPNNPDSPNKKFKIKILKDKFDMNPKIQILMMNKLDNVQQEIDNQNLPCYVVVEDLNGQTNYQRWMFSFKGKEFITKLVSKLVLVDSKLERQMVEQNFPSAFKDKCISGILDFPGDYPKSAPKFSFNLINGETLQHLNIYGGGLFCVPLFTTWNASANISEIQILQTIEHIFHNPNLGDPANPPFSQLTDDQQFQIQLKQAQQLEDFRQ